MIQNDFELQAQYFKHLRLSSARLLEHNDSC